MDRSIDLSPLMQKVHDGADLVVVSQVLFMTSQIVTNLDPLAEECHRKGARLLVDAYHAIGVFPVDVVKMKADFMIGGSYKYLRGGPGAAFLYVSPDALVSDLKPIDIGWFAKGWRRVPRIHPSDPDLLSGSRRTAARSPIGGCPNPNVLH